ncbi:nucleolus and neural progenitor protein isoform X1 [Channa argus]|uniref:nucleolus and neural progenitor protein isoform X1 n=2 Tax=Channa argus TaxID=215402 RepID=UPI002945CE6D|nr:hypothetical protein Q8A73_010205 [Channa argus]
MAGEPWNKVNIPFPSAVSSVRTQFSSKTGARVKAVLVENEKVLKLIQSEILQTEIRVLYELLYILNNSYTGNKTFKGLQQVEQCINRLKNMNLDIALQDLNDLCPNRIQRGLSIRCGEGDVPSQPMLEWLCLKVLGAAQLMSCTLSRCNKAFILTKQQMKWEEFVILNMVITSMLSRLWVIFRGILFSLSTLYQQLLELLRDVAHAKPMPFLTDFSLPADMAQFLVPSDAFHLIRQRKLDSQVKDPKESQQGTKISSVKVKKKGQARKAKEDLGVAIKRDIVRDADMKPFLEVFGNFTEGTVIPQEPHRTYKKKNEFKKQLRNATTFKEMATHLNQMILWCRSEGMKKEKRLLNFLRLKCQKMKSLEEAGYNVHGKLQTFRQEACWASSPQGSVPRTCRSSIALRRTTCLRARFQSLKGNFRYSRIKTGVKKKSQKEQQKRTKLSTSGLLGDGHRRTSYEASSNTTECDRHDDIDDIFSSLGL